MKSIAAFPQGKLSHCVFEHVYFARPDSEVFGQSVNEVRTNLGRLLARETGVASRCGRADSGLGRLRGDRLCRGGATYRCGLDSSGITTSDRTFIEPAQAIRHFGVKVKLNPVKSILAGQRVVSHR